MAMRSACAGPRCNKTMFAQACLHSEDERSPIYIEPLSNKFLFLVTSLTVGAAISTALREDARGPPHHGAIILLDAHLHDGAVSGQRIRRRVRRLGGPGEERIQRALLSSLSLARESGLHFAWRDACGRPTRDTHRERGRQLAKFR